MATLAASLAGFAKVAKLSYLELPTTSATRFSAAAVPTLAAVTSNAASINEIRNPYWTAREPNKFMFDLRVR